MSKPKNRQTIFVVIRTCQGDEGAALCESYDTLESAEQAAGRMYQKFKDQGFEGFQFQVRTVTYYDE